VRLRDGDEVVAERRVAGDGHLPEMVRLRTDGRVDVVEVEAGPDGVLVSDLVLTARPRPLNAITVRDHPGDIPGPRSAS
jgi:hypothetical protein